MIKASSLRNAAAVLLITITGAAAQSPAPAPEFKQVYDLVAEHMSGANNAELNRVAVESFVAALRPRVAIAGAPDGGAGNDSPVLSKALLLDGPVAYLRVAKIEAGLPQAIREASRLMSATNKLIGLVLDLRYTGGHDYPAAADTAGVFLKQEKKLFDWGNGMVSSKENNDALALPVATLVNHETAGAPEALAAALRETGAGLLVGGTTAGQAMMAQEYPLSNGQRLRIATGPVRLADDSEFPKQGLKPDIAVEVSPQDERAYYADGFKEISPALAFRGSPAQAVITNRVRRPKFNEAELVRERKEGLAGDLESAVAGPVPEDKPVVHDPALARALDVLKGLAVVRSARSR